MPRARFILKICVCLAVGLVTTVGLAWVAWVKGQDARLSSAWNAPTAWVGVVGEGWPGEAEHVRRSEAFGYDRQSISAEDQSGMLYEESTVSVGVPLRCLRSQRWTALNTESLTLKEHRFTGIELPDIPLLGIAASQYTTFPPLLPTDPLWFRLLGNTVCWAVFPGLVVWGIPMCRGWVRFRGGRCVRCGFDVRGQVGDVCSECGHGREGLD